MSITYMYNMYIVSSVSVDQFGPRVAFYNKIYHSQITEIVFELDAQHRT